MTRDACKSEAWFNEWIEFNLNSIQKSLEQTKKPPGNPLYRPQYVYDISNKYISLILRKYSRGDSIHELLQYFSPLITVWEEAERLGKNVWTEKQQYTRHAWKVNLDHYIACFWLVGLALSLNISDDLWWRLLALIGNEGEDALLDRIIATRQPDRRIGEKLCHPKPYQRLFEAVLATSEKQPTLLLVFVDKWYKELNRSPKMGLSEDAAVYERPYWYNSHKLEGGYFGYWCIEAVAAVKAFGLDDRLCLRHPNYPGDLLRPDEATTHLKSKVLESNPSAEVASNEMDASAPTVGLFTRWFGRNKPRQ
ncbi:transmembrane protein [Rhodanobacter fulvus Jip2]|uniref:Transmembrane protein n=1 Tax=Rhodanobacter fulvus Jip2 TaxID=1163408 RepID=I4VMH5_9GAMM|nr:PoNi-like cognate immunity protein [Rhodanobacter fulvus]EIL88416.1 transmembrane protein [Rhodanobacter fulvus Jip2]